MAASDSFRNRPGAAEGARAFLATASITLVGIAVVFFMALFYVAQVASEPGPTKNAPASKIFEAPKGASMSTIAKKLEHEGFIRSALLFRVSVRVLGIGGTAKAGEYAISPGASMVEIYDMLRKGRGLQYSFTVPEGFSSALMMDALNANAMLNGAVVAAPPEGSILPETYLFGRNTDRNELIRRMQDAQKKVLADLWAKRAASLPISSPEEAVILASVVEKETSVPEEYGQVAAVFINRLRQGIRLESDPTIIYGITKGRPLGRTITRADIDTKTPWNTYTIDGLPATPISNPSRQALAAVLNPPSSSNIIFVADGTGGHAFAQTLDEHNENVKRWYAIKQAKAKALAAIEDLPRQE
ncbi:MAG: endolytic transglycosylase MltG [Caulobacterales bacterium]